MYSIEYENLTLFLTHFNAKSFAKKVAKKFAYSKYFAYLCIVEPKTI